MILNRQTGFFGHIIMRGEVVAAKYVLAKDRRNANKRTRERERKYLISVCKKEYTDGTVDHNERSLQMEEHGRMSLVTRAG